MSQAAKNTGTNTGGKSEEAKPVSRKAATKAAPAKKASKAKPVRQNTSKDVKTMVWLRAAGHCELCGKDLTLELVSLKNLFEGEVAHIFPAAPGGPRGHAGYTEADAKHLTNDPANLMLLCPNCHKSIDKTPDGVYPADDLTDRHQGFLERIHLAAMTPHNDFGVGIIVLGKHFSTASSIEPTEVQRAMFAEGVRPHTKPHVLVLPEIPDGVRDARYYHQVRLMLTRTIERELSAARSEAGDAALLAIAGLADIPSLMIAGRVMGDRRRRLIFSLDRDTRLRWPDPAAVRPVYQYTPPPEGDGPVALVLSISASIPHDDVLAAVPGGRVATFAAEVPSTQHVKNAGFIAAFREQLQIRLSELEASTDHPIHLFAAIPVAYAVEFGALLSMNHQHGYRIYDRMGAGKEKPFVFQLDLDHDENPNLKEVS
jgi:5-methylcytosine-specific restriction endonuclease McrA